MRTRGLQPRLLYPVRLTIKMEGEKRSFPDKTVKEYTFSKPALQECEKVYFKKSKKNSERERNKGTKGMK